MFVGFGTLVNSISVLIGSLVGIYWGRIINPKLKEGITYSIGLFTLLIGLKLIIENKPDMMKVFFILTVGTSLGFLLDIEGKLSYLFKGSDKSVMNSFIASSIIFTVGPMTLLGCILEGTRGDSSLILSKAVMDGLSSIIFASTLGKGVIFSSLYILIFQGAITLIAFFYGEFIDEESLANTLFMGGGMMVMIAFNLWNLLGKISLINFLPSLIISLFI